MEELLKDKSNVNGFECQEKTTGAKMFGVDRAEASKVTVLWSKRS